MHTLSLLFPSFLYLHRSLFFFFFNDTATTEIYTLSLHDALPISEKRCSAPLSSPRLKCSKSGRGKPILQHRVEAAQRSEEHTSELQSRQYLVCRLLLEKKKNTMRSCRTGT